MATLNDSDVSLSDESLEVYTSGEEGDEPSSEEPECILVPTMVGKHFNLEFRITFSVYANCIKTL